MRLAFVLVVLLWMHGVAWAADTDCGHVLPTPSPDGSMICIYHFFTELVNGRCCAKTSAGMWVDSGNSYESVCPSGYYCPGGIYVEQCGTGGNIACSSLGTGHDMSDAGADTASKCYKICDDGAKVWWPDECAVVLPCASGITQIRTSTGLVVPLYAEKYTEPSICVRYNNTVCYANLAQGRADNAINVNYNGVIYHAVQ